MSVDPVERALDRAAPLSDIMIEGLWLQLNLARLKISHPMWLHLNMAAWIQRIVPEIHKIVQDGEMFTAAIARNRAYSEERPSRLIELLGGVEIFGKAVVRWAEDPSSCVAELDQGIDGLLRAIYRFDPSAYDNCVAGTLVTSPSPGKVVFKL